jgi:processive 1,2-diacylglycerol beta-glucosyltransferase
LQVQHIDMMQLVPVVFRTIYSDWYLKVAQHAPELWGWLYRRTDRAPGKSLRGQVWCRLQRYFCRRLHDAIKRYQPDVIVCTHFLPAEVLMGEAKENSKGVPVWIQVTDFDLHQMWVHPGVSGYFVGNEELAFRLHRQGVPPSKVLVSGIPVMPGFVNRPQRASACADLQLDPTRFTLLLMGGGAGMGMDPLGVAQWLTIWPEWQIIVMTGKNQVLREALEALQERHPDRLRTIGFTDDVASLMAAADLAITKPGGLSTSECLVCGLPMLLVNPIPGQEERNAAYLLQEGVAWRADDPLILQYRLQTLFTDPDRLALMRQRSLALGKPRAAQAVLERVSWTPA